MVFFPTVSSHVPTQGYPDVPEQWQTLADQQRNSGLSAAKLCKQVGVGYACFCNWRKRLSSYPAVAPTLASASY
ncbi:IS66 family insertion sequence element accessory protein TnpA [Hydrocarboniclastica marina]|uniref:Transposase n=1 Tax=Hydrocarboniclastica marina TaxID=2259620 RepID=A0A4P7XK01_9ALTE|nr:hypothetical protein soil367_17110 [Hydrocarboniclastica marina]